MYEIRPESIVTFIEDGSIRLPRFQRKQTWDAKRNFELCISVFKEFPIGVCILNVEADERGRTTKWLLDGRQRRNALVRMWEDPENIYQWGRKWIGFKTGDQPADVEDKFREKMSDYLEDEDEDQGVDNALDLQDSLGLAEVADDIEIADSILPEPEENAVRTADEHVDLTIEGIDFLLQIIRLIHNKTARYSGFTRPFDFTKEISTLPYIENLNGRISLSSKKLKSFISSYKQHCKDENLDVEIAASFKHFMNARFPLNAASRTKIERQIDDNWAAILERMELLNRIQSLLLQSKIGLIELKNIKTTDSQKIFNIINSKGTKLNAVEILSAKPSWNTEIKHPSGSQVDATKALYQRIEVKNDGVVKWDLPATLLPRLSDSGKFFRFGGDKNTGLDKQLTLGFKLMSGLFEGGVRKEDVDALSKNTAINWELHFDALINDLNQFTKLILSANYFRFFASWQTSLMSITSDAVALNFFLVLFKDWERKGKPIGADAKAKTFQKNAFILLDQLIFEYVNRQWRGSSDSKIANNLSLAAGMDNLFKHVPKSKWLSLLSDIFDKNVIDSVSISQKVMEPLLFHFYSLIGISGPTGNDSFEVDHILPQASFKSSAISEADVIQHNLFNLGLLPKRDNAAKSNKKLSEIDNTWLENQIRMYEFIEKKDFVRFSSLNNLDELRAHRVPHFEKAFSDTRDELLAN